MSRKNSTENNLSAIATILAMGIFVMGLPLLNLSPLLLSLLVLICFNFLFLLINPKWGLFFLLLLRPILDFSSNLKIVEIGSIPVNLASLLGLVVVSTTFILYLNNQPQVKRLTLFKPWFLFVIVLFLSLLISFDKASSINEFIRFLTVFSSFVLGSVVIKNRSDLLMLVNVIILSMLIPSLVALYQLLTNTGLTLSYQDVPNRLFGTFAHPNLFAFSLTLSIALSLAMFLKSKNLTSKIIYGFSFLSYFTFLALTYTRGAWILLVFMIISAGILKLHKTLTIFIILFFCLYIAIAPVRERINSITTLSPYSSITWRFNLWSDAIQYVKDAPILGHGTGTSKELIEIRRGATLGSTAPHNDFLKIILENGILGLLAFLIIFVTLSKNIFMVFMNAVKQKKEDLFLPLIFFCFTVGLYAASFGDNILEATVLQWTFWSLVGAFLNVTNKTRIFT